MTKVQSSRRREQIAAAAITILAEKGGRGLTHRAVDRHLDLPSGTTSRFFRTRLALVTAAVDGLTESDVNAFATLASEVGEEDDIRTYCQRLLKYTSERIHLAARLELMLESSRNPVVRSRFQQPIQQMSEILASRLAISRDPTPEVTARLLLGTILSLSVLHLLGRPEDADAALGDALDRYL